MTNRIIKDKNRVKAKGSTPGIKAKSMYDPFSISPKTNPPKKAP
jgi:hypothetical protein